jgi:hypothetical protein
MERAWAVTVWRRIVAAAEPMFVPLAYRRVSGRYEARRTHRTRYCFRITVGMAG